jgi:hypothetical protein
MSMVIAMFTKRKYTISREITINTPKEKVFDFIRFNRNQKLYSKWLSFDPNTKIELKGVQDGMPGSVLAFESANRKTGKGEWEIKKVSEGNSLDFELRFISPFPFTANGQFFTEALSSDKTKLKWVYNSGMNWPANIMLVFMNLENIIGNDMAESLGNIKRNLE